MAIQTNFPAVKPNLLLDFASAKTLDPRVTFTRAGTATYYDGKTYALAEQNLFLYSEGPYDSTNGVWNLVGGTMTGSQTAPDGTSTAWLFKEDAGTNTTHRFYNAGANVWTPGLGKSVAVSCYLKYAGRQYVQFNCDTWRTGCRVIFDIQNGTVSDSANALSATIQSVGNGWYRAKVVAPATSGGNNSFAIGSNSASTGNGETHNGSNANSFYVWGVQIEYRDAVAAYAKTTTTVVSNYIPQLLTAGNNQPRFTHNPITGESQGLLLEQQSTNLIRYSQAFASGAWTGPATFFDNYTVSPEGLLTGSALLESNGTSNYQRVQQGVTVTAGTTFTATLYAKAGKRNWLTIDAGPTVYYNLSNGTIGANSSGSATASITHVGNGWYRCIYTYTNPTTTFTYYLGTSTNGSDGGLFTGSGTPSIYIWGAQLEATNFATSYIPTTSASATRAADSAYLSDANFTSWFTPGAGTILYDTGVANYIQDGRVMWQLDNGISGYYQILYSSYSIGGNYYPSTRIPSGQTATGPNVNIFAFDVNGSSIAANGSAASNTNADPHEFNSARRFVLGSANYPIRKFVYYPQKLADANLTALTA